MHNYAATVLTPAAAAGAAFATIRAPAAGRSQILEISIFNTAATAASIGLFRTTNTFVPTTSAVVLPEDPADTVGATNLDTAWSTAPTIGTVALRRVVFAAAIGIGVIWRFENLICGPAGTTGLVLWNFGGAAGGILSVGIVTDPS